MYIFSDEKLNVNLTSMQVQEARDGVCALAVRCCRSSRMDWCFTKTRFAVVRLTC